MLDLLRRLFGSGNRSENPDEEKTNGKESAAAEDSDSIKVHSCEVIDVEIIDDELH